MTLYPHTEAFRLTLIVYTTTSGSIEYHATDHTDQYDLFPKKDSWEELKKGRTKIVDVDFIIKSTVDIFDDNGNKIVYPYKVGWRNLIIYDGVNKACLKEE